MEATIREGGCEGAPVHTQVFGLEQDAAVPPVLPPGVYGFELVARDAECRAIGFACRPADIASTRELVLDISREDEGAACGDGSVCDAGRCVPGDGGVPCGCVDEAGTCHAGTELGACGSGGGLCEVCCGGGVDRCEAGRCVPLASRRVTSVSAGSEHTCILLERGDVYCWGSNERGQLAAGDLPSSLAPIQIGSAPDWTLVHGAFSSVCGSRRSGGTRCWGWNFSAQIGTGSPTPERVAAEQAIAVPAEPVELRSGRFHACARAADGSVYCWGSNGIFALWQDTMGHFVPTPIVAPAGAPASWEAVRVGVHRTCLLGDGQQWCAGYGAQGRIGVPASALVGGSPHVLEDPIRVAPDIRWADLALGVAHSCGLDDAGRLYCWGCGGDCDPAHDACDPMNLDSNADVRDCSYALGFLPDSGFFVELPELVDPGPFLAVAASEHTCVILDDGGGDGAGPLVCFGPNEHGQLGDGTTEAHGFDARFAVMGGARFRAVSTGLRHTCAIRDTGALYCWGFGDDRALGTTDLTPEDPAAHEARMRESTSRPRRACID